METGNILSLLFKLWSVLQWEMLVNVCEVASQVVSDNICLDSTLHVIIFLNFCRIHFQVNF